MSDWKESSKLALILAIFIGLWFLPVENAAFMGAVNESLALVKWYAREHVILCLVPAFFIAGAIGVFVSQGAVMKYLGPKARKVVAYPVAAVSGTVLAVCSCTVLPLFAGIHKRGAGLGPASAFLYSGPAINVLAIIMTARILGPKLGIARAVAAVIFAVVIGLLMHLIFRRDESGREAVAAVMPQDDETGRPLWKDGLFFTALLGILVFANWGAPQQGAVAGVWAAIHSAKWIISGAFVVMLIVSIIAWFSKDELRYWVDSSWTFAKQILPLLLGGVLVAGLLLGGPGGGSGLIPDRWVQGLVGGNSLTANLFASVVGVFMYFATLTEVPILEGLLNSGMGQGPALALLLAGPALSLPSVLVIHSVLGVRKTAVFVGLVVVLSTAAGLIYGWIA